MREKEMKIEGERERGIDRDRKQREKGIKRERTVEIEKNIKQEKIAYTILRST